MTDMDELNGILGATVNNSKRGRPHINQRRHGKKQKGNQKPAVQTPVAPATEEPMMTVHTENGSVQVPFNQENIDMLFPTKDEAVETQTEKESEMSTTETTTQATETVDTAPTWPELKDAFTSVVAENTWKHIGSCALTSVRTGKFSPGLTFRGIERLKDTERSPEARAITFIDLIRFIGASMFGAELETDIGFTKLSFGIAKSTIEVIAKEVDDKITFVFNFDATIGIGRAIAAKFTSGEGFGIERLDDAIIALHLARTIFYRKLFTTPEVIDLIKKEAAEMVK